MDYSFVRESPIGDGTYIELCYRKDYGEYTMEVEQVYGKLHGCAAMTTTDGETVGEARFVRGRMKSFTEYHDDSETQYTWSSDTRTGSYVESDQDGYVIERGDVMEGNKIVCIKRCPTKRGFFLMYDHRGTVKAVASMDRKGEMKNGKYYDIKNEKVVKVSMYVDGVFNHSLSKEPVEDDSGKVLYPMKMYHEDLNACCDYSSSYNNSSPSFTPAAGIAIAGGALAIGGAVAYWLSHRKKDDSYKYNVCCDSVLFIAPIFVSFDIQLDSWVLLLSLIIIGSVKRCNFDTISCILPGKTT